MEDIALLGLTILFFALCFGMIKFFDILSGGE